MRPLVSVIIPAYNSEKLIRETMESVLKQTWNYSEIIVVDDGSKDNTLALLKQYKAPNVKIFTQQNKGACAARNLGLKIAKGEFIQFLDADDILAPDKIELQLQRLLSLEDSSKKLIHCQWGRFYKSIDENIKWGPHEDIRQDLNPAEWLIYNRMSMTGCWLTPRVLINLGGPWDESLRRNQDGEFFSRLLTHADEVLYSSEAKIYYRSGLSSSISGDNSKPAATSALKSIDLIKDYTLKLEDSERARLSLANKYKDFAYANYIMFPDLAHKAEIKSNQLGGANAGLEGGRVLKILNKALGWKSALKIKAFYSKLSHR